MTSKYGPEQRELLETAAGRVYSNAVAHGHLLVDDPSLSDEALRPAIDLLLDIGLLSQDEEAGRYIPVDPAEIQSRVVVPLGQQGD